MDDTERFGQLVGHLVNTAKAHHEATGGQNPHWATWYASRLTDDVNEIVGSDFTAETLAAWLVEADRRYRSEEPADSWPKVYARWLLDGSEGD